MPNSVTEVGAGLKVAHVTTIDFTLRYVITLLRYLVACGYQVFGVSSPGPYVPGLEAKGIRHHGVALTRLNSPLADLSGLRSLYREFKTEKYDIVHTHTPKGNLLGQWAAFFARTPVRVTTVHGLYFTPKSSFLRKLIFSFVESISLIPAHKVFLINRQDYATVRKLRLGNMRKVQLLLGGIGTDIERFNRARMDPSRIQQTRCQYGIQPDDIVIGFVGRLVYEKGILELLRAFAALAATRSKLRLLLVGPIDVDKADALSPAVIDELGIRERTVLTGAVDDPAPMYAIMDIYALPSYREGMPLSTMEAQSMGLPVVTTDARGCIESILDQETGLIVPARDVQALTLALAKLIDDTDLRVQMGQNARRFAEERYDDRRINAQVEAFYRELLAAHK